MPDFYGLGADESDEARENRARAEKLSAVPKKSNTAAWAIGIGLAAFVGLPFLLGSVTELVRASKE